MIAGCILFRNVKVGTTSPNLIDLSWPPLLCGASNISKSISLTKLHSTGAPLCTYFVEVDISTSQCTTSDRPAYDLLADTEYVGSREGLEEDEARSARQEGTLSWRLFSRHVRGYPLERVARDERSCVTISSF